MKITHVLTDNGKAVTDRLSGLRKRAATGQHEFDLLCAELGIEHRLAPPMRPQTNDVIDKCFRSCSRAFPWAHRLPGSKGPRSRSRPPAPLSSSHLICGARAHCPGPSRRPAVNEACVGRFGLFHPAPFLVAVALDVVGVRGPLLATSWLAARLQFDIPQLLGM